jgi:hypothetical protein
MIAFTKAWIRWRYYTDGGEPEGAGTSSSIGSSEQGACSSRGKSSDSTAARFVDGKSCAELAGIGHSDGEAAGGACCGAVVLELGYSGAGILPGVIGNILEEGLEGGSSFNAVRDGGSIGEVVPE